MMKNKLSSILPLILMIAFIFASCERRSGRRNIKSQETNAAVKRSKKSTSVPKDKTVLKMKKNKGVYYLPCKINGTPMEFIFDTGASDITISLTEAMFLYKQGTLTDNDFLGTQKYQIANGDIEEGTVIKLKTVELGNLKLNNVQASIVHNIEAPLLLGQTALSQFGKISIDYSRNEITFE